MDVRLLLVPPAPPHPTPPIVVGAGIKVLEAIDITDKDALFASNMLAFVTVHQHAGLAFLMLKRYKDAARILNEVGGRTSFFSYKSVSNTSAVSSMIRFISHIGQIDHIS